MHLSGNAEETEQTWSVSKQTHYYSMHSVYWIKCHPDYFAFQAWDVVAMKKLPWRSSRNSEFPWPLMLNG